MDDRLGAVYKESSNWLVNSYTPVEFKTIKQLAQVAAKLQLKRLEKKLSQKDLAKKMGVTQGMVSKWESGEYNFTISSLIEICEKLDLEFIPVISDKYKSDEYEYKDLENEASSKLIKPVFNEAEVAVCGC